MLSDALMEQVYYIRPKPHELQSCDVITWSSHFEKTENRIIKKTQIKDAGYIIEISTVFLGLVHGRNRENKPYLFETMSFCDSGEPELDLPMNRYVSEADAIIGHEKIEENIKNILKSMKPFKGTITGKDIDLREIEASIDQLSNEFFALRASLT